MGLGGDPDELRRMARRLREQAGEVEHTAGRVGRAEGVEWVGLSADRFRDRLREHGREIARTRRELVDASSALDHLADELEERQLAIARAMDLVEAELSAARRTVSGFAGGVWDTLTGAERAAERAARGLLDSVTHLPSPGHPDWLDLARRMGGMT